MENFNLHLIAQLFAFFCNPSQMDYSLTNIEIPSNIHQRLNYHQTLLAVDACSLYYAITCLQIHFYRFTMLVMCTWGLNSIVASHRNNFSEDFPLLKYASAHICKIATISFLSSSRVLSFA
jgi:hypothetical protein